MSLYLRSGPYGRFVQTFLKFNLRLKNIQQLVI
jgi:hypothetical protein